MSFGSFSVSWDFSDVQAYLPAPPPPYVPPSAPAVTNVVTIALPPPLPTPSDPAPQQTVVTAVEQQSIALFGEVALPPITAIVADVEQAFALAEYLGRAEPAFWFSGFRITLRGLANNVQAQLAELEIGTQLLVSKRFRGVADPVVQELFLEGIEHEITPVDHTIVLYTGPGVFWECFELDTSELGDENYGLAGTQPC